MEIIKAIKVIGFNRKMANEIIHSRPFDNIGDLFWQKSFTPNNLTNNEFVEGCMKLFTEKLEEAFNKKDFSILSKEAQIIKNFQNSKHDDISSFNWESIWSFYRVVKSALTTLNEEAHREENQKNQTKIKELQKQEYNYGEKKNDKEVKF